jgi:TonB family protein
VLAHELAHIRRRDPAILLLAQLANVVYWFHPLCWFAAARLRMESERACDDAALRIGLRPSGYAGELLDLARLFNPQPAIPMAATSHLESRVKSILDPLVNRSLARPRAWLAGIAIAAALSAPLAVVTLRAQAPAGSGTINGTVMDPSGAVVPRAQVMASSSQGGTKEITVSDMAGNFTFDNLPSGDYAVEVSVPFFALYRQDVTLMSAGTVNTPVRLLIGHIIDKVSVVAEGSVQPALSTAASGGRPIRVGGNTQPASVIFKPDPVYPAALQAAGIEGTVLIEAVISKDGLPLSLKPQNTAVDPAFISAAMDSVRQWRWRPTMLNGEPIEVLATMQVDFKLRPNGTAAK